MLARAKPVDDGPVVVVTGSSSGMGRDAALHLNALGYTVVAGVRKDADGDRVHADAARPEAFHPMLLDVVDDAQVSAAVNAVRELLPPDRGVRALFSNAGIAAFSGDVSCEGQSIEALTRVVDVNFVGAVRFVRAFLSLVRAERGSVVVNSAMMTRVVIPFNGGYAASKCALEGWVMSLRREVASRGVRVSVIRPAAVATDLASHQAPDSVPTNSVYPEQHAVVDRFMSGMAEHRDDPHCSPRRVSELVARIIATERPRAAYRVGGGSRVLAAVSHLPEPVQTRLLRKVLRSG